MNTLEDITKRYSLNTLEKIIEIPNTDRKTLAELFCVLGFKYGAEMGVERGIYSEVLLKANPQLKLFSIDAWTAYQGYRDHVSQEKMDELLADAHKRLDPYQRCTLIKGFSTDVVKQFEDESLDFVYIDGNHEYQQVVNDVCEWDKKVKVGGIVAGHDYIKRRGGQYLMHVPQAIEGYVDAYQIRPLFILGRKHASEGEKRDSSRSWFYVKQARQSIVPHKSA